MPAHLKLADAKTYIEEVLSYKFNNIDYLEEALSGKRCVEEVACNEYLAALPHAVGVARFVNMNAGMTAMSEYMRATAVEAIFGAVFNDCRGDYQTLLKAVTAMGVFAGLESDEE
ncbi:hypothetical protein LTR17_019235 [Elasticomyces elasticus]|nr:hypothetical protein LTR17_019235 [Elasticomyces elasticus]